MPFFLIQTDITKIKTDAIVNVTNRELLRAETGYYKNIYQVVQEPDALWEECRRKAPCPAGQSVATSSYGLPAKFIIHTVEPDFSADLEKQKTQLVSCYYTAMELAEQLGCRSIAFPLIFPKNLVSFSEARNIARHTIVEFLHKMLCHYYNLDVYLLIYRRREVKLDEKLKKNLDRYISNNYQDYPLASLRSWNDGFTKTLLHLIEQKGCPPAEIYKRVNIDRKLFHKIHSQEDYHPEKRTILAFAIALHLTIEETNDLLRRAGYILSPSQATDVIISYFLVKKIYDIYEINKTLAHFGEKEL